MRGTTENALKSLGTQGREPRIHLHEVRHKSALGTPFSFLFLHLHLLQFSTFSHQSRFNDYKHHEFLEYYASKCCLGQS